MRKGLGAGVFIAAIAAAGTGFAGQHEGHQGGAATSAAAPDIAECRGVQPVVAQTIKAAVAQLEAARQTNAPAAMRAAVDGLQLTLATLERQLAPCAAMQVPVAPVAVALAPAAAAATKSEVEIGFRAVPDPPTTGNNTFEVTVKDRAGKPVTNAEVAVVFFMPAMPNMAAMRNETPLSHAAAGVSRGSGQVLMAGAWTVTVNVTASGKPLGTTQLAIVAK
jgi:hypothetical protein